MFLIIFLSITGFFTWYMDGSVKYLTDDVEPLKNIQSRYGNYILHIEKSITCCRI